MADLGITLILECGLAPESPLRPDSSTASVRDTTEFSEFRASDFNFAKNIHRNFGYVVCNSGILALIGGLWGLTVRHFACGRSFWPFHCNLGLSAITHFVSSFLSLCAFCVSPFSEVVTSRWIIGRRCSDKSGLLLSYFQSPLPPVFSPSLQVS